MRISRTFWTGVLYGLLIEAAALATVVAGILIAVRLLR